MMVVVVMRAVVMAVITFQKNGADEIHHQAEAGNGNRLIEMDDLRVDDSLQRFDEHDQGHDSQGDGTCKASQDIDFAGAECIGWIVCVFSRISIGEDRYHKCGDMRAHVPTVGQKRHRTVDTAGNDFQDHCHGCKCQDIPGPPLSGFIDDREIVAVLPVFQCISAHFRFLAF